MILFFKLLFAHVLSDFFFQTDKIIKGKESRTSKRHVYQLCHSLTHAAVAYLVVADWSCWIIALIVFISHLIMDYIKVECLERNLNSFVVDQVFHLIVIIGISMFAVDGNLLLHNWIANEIRDSSIWIVSTSYLLVLKPSAIAIGMFIKKWTPSDSVRKSLPNAGKWIGYLERILILTFIFAGNPEAIGFLLAAKSIFRFGELSKATEIKTTEYVLVGTLASFTVAILIGFAGLMLLKN